MSTRKVAVIGIGSNSVRMLVAEAEEDGFRRLTRDREGTRLFAGLDDEGNLSRESMEKTVAAIAGLVCFTALYLATIDIQLPFSAQLGPIVAAFLLTGALLKNYNVAIYLETGFHEFRYWAIFITAVILGAVMIIMFPTGMKMYNSYFGAYGPWSVFTFYLFAIFCGTVLWYIAVFLIKVPIVSDVFKFAGISSLVFYTLHMFIAKLITAPFVTIGTDFWITVNADNQRFLVLMLTLIILSLLTIALNRMKGTLKEENIDTDSIPSSSMH